MTQLDRAEMTTTYAAIASIAALVLSMLVLPDTASAGSDAVPPTVAVSVPAGNSTVAGTIAISGTASDNVAIMKVKYRVDRRGDYRTASGTTQWTGTVDTTTFDDGSHVLSVRAVDTSGNGITVTVTFAIDNGSGSPPPETPPSPSPSPSGSPTSAPSPAPTTASTVWGIYSASRGGMGGQEVTAYIESLIGRRFGGQRIYTNMSHDVPDGDDLLVASQGGVIYHNINSFYVSASGTKVCRPWRDVAAGTYDDWWTHQAENIKAFGYPMLLSFNHEPTSDAPSHPSCGTADEFRAAYDHIVQLFDGQGVGNVTWVWTLTAATFNGRQGGPTAWEPSDYDIVGVDGYNRASKWRSPAQIFQAAQDFAVLRGKPLLVGEIGCEELPGDPVAKANWITQVTAMFRSFGDVKAVLWSNDSPYWIDSSQQALEAFIQAGADPYYGG